MTNPLKAMMAALITVVVGCADNEPVDSDILCNHDGVDLRISEGYVQADCIPDEQIEAGGDAVDASDIDITKPFVDLGVLGVELEYHLGAWRNLMLFDPLVTRAGPVGFGQLGGSEDYDAEHAVSYIRQVINLDVTGDGRTDAQYAAIRFVEDADEPFIGNVLNLDEEDCRDPDSEYYGLAGCWMMFPEHCGAEFTAWDMEEANRGECTLSLVARDGELLQGPQVSTF